MSNEQSKNEKETRISTVQDLQNLVDTTLGADVNINEFKIPKVEKTELDKIIEEKCVKVIATVICEGDVISINSGRYWVEGTVVRVSRFGIAILNPSKEYLIRLGKINMVTIHKRGEIYQKYKEAIDSYFKNI